MNARPLADLDPGQSGEIVDVSGGGDMEIRLLEMGLTPGVRITVVKRAPLGDPLELRVRGYHVSLRRAEAATVQVVPT